MKNCEFEKEHGYELFKTFLRNFVIEKKSFLWDEENIENDTIKKCWEILVKNPQEGNKTFEEKLKEQFGGEGGNLRDCICDIEYLYYMGVSDIKKDTKINKAQRWKKLQKVDKFLNGFGGAGTFFSTNKYEELRFLLTIMYHLRNISSQNIDDIIKEIESICTGKKDLIESEVFKEQNLNDEVSFNKMAMKNSLLHMANPEKYERIFSYDHKYTIVSTFNSLLENEEKELSLDDKISRIRKKIAEFLNKDDFDFYSTQKVASIWRPKSEEYNYALTSLRYKKAIVLYGPPGTGKTFSARNLANSFILQEYSKINSKYMCKYIESLLKSSSQTKELDDIFKQRIHYLQLHPNYQYENFVMGVQLKQQKMKPMKGAIFRYCEDAEKDEYELPHIVILDEINRVDFTRMLGEVFSAIENRNAPVSVLSLGKEFSLRIPENLYFIGTMNEIDFSLERVDFALRRRFVWIPHNYSEDSLRNIIEYKDQTFKENYKDFDRFCTNVTKLNSYISQDRNWGVKYQIGHTFFADIVDISNKFFEEKNKRKRIYSNSDNYDSPAGILWNISIRPQLEAMLGYKQDQNTEIKKLKEIFFEKGK